MFADMLLPSVAVPLMVMLVAAGASLRLYWAPALGVLVAIFVAFGWIQGFRLEHLMSPVAMDGIWLMTLVAVIAACLDRWRAVVVMMLGLPISVLVVWVFAATITPLEWFGIALALLVPVALLAHEAGQHKDQVPNKKFWMLGYLVSPVAILAPTIGLAGSIKLALIAGAFGVVMALCWGGASSSLLIAAWQPSRLWRRLVASLSLPLVWVALSAYLLVEVPAQALLPAALPWLVGSLFATRLAAMRWWLQLAALVVVTALPMVFSLWYVWPSPSMY